MTSARILDSSAGLPAVLAEVWAVLGGHLILAGAWDGQDPDEWPERIRPAVAFVMGILTELDEAYAHDLQKLCVFLGEARIPAAEFTPARAMEFLQWLRLVSSSRRAQRLELGVASSDGRVLSAKTCNRVMAAVSSFYEFLIVSEGYAGRDNPVVKVANQAAAGVPVRYRRPLDNASSRPVRRVLRVKTVEALPGPMSAETYGALLGKLRTRRDPALLEVMWEAGLRPGEVLGPQLEDISYGQPCECDLYLTCANSSPPPSTRRSFGTACAWSGNWPTTPKSAAGTVKPTVTSAPPTASEACSANPPAGQKTRPEWATVPPTADPPAA